MDKKGKTIQGNTRDNYSQDDFLNDLQKVCSPVNKPGKPKSTSDKT